MLLTRRSVEANFDNMKGGDPAAGGGASGSSSDGAEEEKYSWVPVRVARLTNLLHHLSAVQQSRWLNRHRERGWVARAEAAMGPEPERQLKLARDLCEIMSSSWFGYACRLHDMTENVAEAVGALRPRPESAAWWQFRYVNDVLPGSHGFVHLTWGQAARVRGLVADAAAWTSRIRAQVDDLRRQCWPAPPAGAGVIDAAYSTPALLARMRCHERTADAVLLPLQELNRLIDHLIEVNNNNLRGRGGRERQRRRRRSAPPSRRTPATEPMLRRNASI